MWRQRIHLSILVLVHLAADLFGGLLGAILPVLCERFSFSLTVGLALITLMGLSSNLFQVVAGHLPGTGEKPWIISAGILVAGCIPLVALVPPGPAAFWTIGALLVVGGAGIAFVHPDGLRGVYRLDSIPASFATACFMVGGFGGFAGGAWVAGALVERYGLAGLLRLIPIAVALAVVIPFTGIRLQVDTGKKGQQGPNPEAVPHLPFSLLLLMGSIVAASALILTNLLPTHLHGQGHSLAFGGRSVFLFGLGGAAGSLFWGAVAARRGFFPALCGSLAIGLPILVAYLLLTAHAGAIWLLGAAGFFLYAAYPLIVTLSRFAHSRLNLGQRMGLIVGGSWGLAGVFVIAMGPVGERFGLSPVLHLTWIGYAAAGLLGGMAMAGRAGPGVAERSASCRSMDETLSSTGTDRTGQPADRTSFR